MKPAKAGKVDIQEYNHPTGGWGSAQSLVRNAAGQGLAFSDIWTTLLRQNKAGGYMCISCSWAKPAEPHVFAFCENGAIRDEIEHCYPDDFRGFNQRFRQPGGFHRDIGASKRVWNTDSGKANFIAPPPLEPDVDIEVAGGDALTLISIRSNDQFNTPSWDTAIGCAVFTEREWCLLMNEEDIVRLGFHEGQEVALDPNADDGVPRRVEGLRVTSFTIPRGNCAGYYPELNPLVPLWHHGKKAHVPAAKSVPVRIAGKPRHFDKGEAMPMVFKR